VLELRPNCEYCDRDLPPDSPDARICSYECTFCADCVETVLHLVCPNCGGGFVPRPIRPAIAHRPHTSLQQQSAASQRVHSKYTAEEIEQFCTSLMDSPADQR